MDIAFCSALVRRHQPYSPARLVLRASDTAAGVGFLNPKNHHPGSWNLLSAIQGQDGDDGNGDLKVLKAHFEPALGILSFLLQLVRTEWHHISLKLEHERTRRADLLL